MRRFILLAHEAATSPDFPLDDLPGAAGRMDLVARCVSSALLVSHAIRRDTEILAVLQGGSRGPRTVRVVGSEVQSLNPDERSTAALIRKALVEEGRAERRVHPGVYVDGRSPDEVIQGTTVTTFVLDRNGADARTVAVPRDVAFVLSDHRDFSAHERELLARRALPALSLGPRSVQSDQAIVLAHNELDRREATTASTPPSPAPR